MPSGAPAWSCAVIASTPTARWASTSATRCWSTPTIPLDADTGTNGRQNFPVITSSTLFGGNLLQVQGTLNSTPNTNFWIDAYANTSCDPLNNGEGDVSVGGNMFLTDGSGNATFSLLVAGVPGKSVITATATGPQGTSEFSQCRTAVVPAVTISGRATLGSGPGAPPLANVTMTLGGGASATVVTDATGSYAFAGLATGGNYTVTPSTAGYVFAPASRPYTNVTTDQVNQDFVGSQPAISGTITRNGSALAGVTVDLTGTSSLSTTTNASGQYAFASLPAGGNFTVTPVLANFAFAPSQTFTNVVADQVANFTATRLYTISGQVRDLNDTGVANVTMTLSGSAGGTQLTDSRWSLQLHGG